MKKNSYRIIAIILTLVLMLQNIVIVQADKTQSIEPKQKVLVKFKEGKNGFEKNTKYKTLKQFSKLRTKNVYELDVDSNTLKTLKSDKDIELIELDSPIRKSTDKITWNIEKVNAVKLQDMQYYGDGINVAVFDTGIDTKNIDLKVKGGISFVDGVTSYNDDNGHGTAVAGIVSALKDDKGMLGVAPNVNLYSVKVLDKDGNGLYSSIINGLQWAIENKINIIVMSFGGNKYSKILEEAINLANNNNILIIAAAGNDGAEAFINYPANYRNVVCVGALDRNNQIASFSNKGYQMDIVAPGVGIETTHLNNSTITINGTSVAVPHVAGIAAQLWSAKKSLTNSQMKALLFKSAKSLGEKGIYGWGLVDAESSLNNIDANFELPADYDALPSQGEPGDGDGTVKVSAVVKSGDEQTINTSQSATVTLVFDIDHPEVIVTTRNDDTGTILRTDTISVRGEEDVSYTCPAGVMNTAGTYKMRFHATDVDPQWDSIVTIYVVNSPQAAPTITSTTATNASIRVNWSSVTGATRYDIKKDGVLDDNVTSPYVHSGLTPNTRHTYQVGAVGAGGTGWSGVVSEYTLANAPISGSLGTPTNNSIPVSWAANGNPTGTQYKVLVYRIIAGVWTPVGTDSWATGQTRTIYGLQPNTNYKFEVKARNGDNIETAVLAVGQASTLPDPPATPSNLDSDSISNNQIRLSWNSVFSADGYYIDADGNETYLTGTSFTHNGLNPNTLHRYRIKAKNLGGTSSWSPYIERYTLANVPSAGVINSKTGNSITLSWNANGNSASTEYCVGVYNEYHWFGLVMVNSESWSTNLNKTVSGLEPNKEYTIKVRARNNADKKTDWHVIGVTKTTSTPVGGLQKPVFKLSNVQKNSITLNWAPVQDATSYVIQRFNAKTGLLEKTDTTDKLYFTDTGLIANTQYLYWVRAKNATVDGPWADKAVVTTQAEIINGDNGTTVGDPVNIVSGNFYSKDVDISLPDIGRAVEIVRNYNSRDTEAGSLGIGWRLDYDSNLVVDGATGDAKLTYPDGQKLTYEAIIGTNNYTTPLYGFDKLVKNADGTYTLELQDNLKYIYNNQGKIVKLIDKNNITITINRDATGNITTVVGTSGKTLTFTYENNKLKKVADPAGRTIDYLYNPAGKLERVENSEGGKTIYTYDDKGLTSITDQNGKKYVVNVYDEEGRVVKQYDENGIESIIPYNDLFMENTYKSGALNGNVKYTYNELLQITKITYEDATYEEFTYDQWGNKKTVRDRNGRTTTYKYNEKGNILLVTTPEPYNYTTSYEYDDNDNLTKVTMPNGSIISYEYDTKGNLLKEIEKIDSTTDAVTIYTYDNYGRVLTETDPEGNTTIFEYGSEIEPIKITDPEGNVTSFTYDELGRNDSITTAYGTTNYVYNSKDKVEKIIDPAGNITRMKYDLRGNLIKKILPKQYDQASDDGAGYTYIYDGMDRLIKEIDPMGNVRATKYDAEGNRIKEINPNYYDSETDDGLGTRYIYDENNRLIKTVNPSSQQSRRKYDAVGNLIKSIDANNYNETADDGPGIEYVYDELNRLVQVKDVFGNTTSQYVYDSSNKVIKKIDAKGYLSGTSESTRYGTLYKYNLAGLLTETRKPVKSENGTIYYNITRNIHDKNGNVIEEKKSPDYVTATSEPTKWYTINYTYDYNGRVKTVTDTTGAYIEYTYDALGNTIRQVSKINNSKSNVIGYKYNSAGRLEKMWTEIDAADLKDGGSGIVKAETLYEHDKNGNVVKETSPEGYITHYDYDNADRLVSKKQEVKKNAISVNSTSILISSPRKTAYPGKEYEYKVDIVPGKTVTATNIDLAYDSRVLELVSAVPTQSGITANTSTIGKIKIAATGINYSERTTLVTLRVKIKDNLKGIGFINIEPTSIYTDDTGKTNSFTELSGKTIYVYGPDMNNDGNVETNDLTFTAAKKGVVSDNPVYEDKFDINDNGVVDVEDIDYIKDWLFTNKSSQMSNLNLVKFYQKYTNSNYEETELDTNRETIYQYDKAGNLVKEIDCNNNSISYIYDTYNRKIAAVDKQGNKTRFFYDEVGNLVKEVKPENYIEATDNGVGTSYIYDEANRLSQVVDANGNIVKKNIYDVNGMITKVIDAKGYLSAGTDALRYGIEYSYDIGNRVVSITTPEAKAKGKVSTINTYDSMDNVITSTDGQGYVTTFERDMWGNPTSVMDAKGIYTYYEYDFAGNVTLSKDGNQKITRYVYNSMNLLQSITDPGNQTITYKYDKEGRLAIETDRNDQTILYGYNNDGNLVSKSIQGKEDYEKYLYNLDGSLLAAINGNALDHYEYTANGNIKKKYRNGKGLLNYEYDKNGNVTNVVDQTGKAVSYNYDTLGRMDTVSDNGVQIADYNYNVDNTIATINYNTGITVTYGYDKDKNISSLIAKNQQNTVINNFAYTYDNNGNQLTKVENNKTTTYTYDQLNRLATAQYQEVGLETYTYDNAGNRKTKMLGANTTSYLYDSRNRLVQSTNNSIITSYNYDKNGNLLDESKSGQKTTYTYDGFNHLKEVNLANGTWMYNEYDASGERIAIAENGVRSDFVIDRGNVIAEIDPSSQNYTRSIRGLSLLAQSNSKAITGYYLNNAHGDVVNMVNGSGQVVNSYQYDAFGNTTSYVEKVANRFMYSGEQFDKISGQYYLRARYYNPVIGRFTQEDTYRGDGLNLYAYVSNNPIRYVDPSGHDKKEAGNDAASIQASFQNATSGGDYDGAYGLQCVDLTKWYIDTYTTLKSARGNGWAQAENIAKTNNLPPPTSIPQAPAVFSVAPGYKTFGASGGEYGHTGIVISVDEANKTVTVIDTYNKLSGKTPNSRIKTFSYPADGVTFTYLGNHLK